MAAGVCMQQPKPSAEDRHLSILAMKGGRMSWIIVCVLYTMRSIFLINVTSLPANRWRQSPLSSTGTESTSGFRGTLAAVSWPHCPLIVSANLRGNEDRLVRDSHRIIHAWVIPIWKQRHLGRSLARKVGSRFSTCWRQPRAKECGRPIK